jgi:hypothetical protein
VLSSIFEFGEASSQYKYIFTDAGSDVMLLILMVIIFLFIGPLNRSQAAPSHAPRDQEIKMAIDDNAHDLERYAQFTLDDEDEEITVERE